MDLVKCLFECKEQIISYRTDYQKFTPFSIWEFLLIEVVTWGILLRMGFYSVIIIIISVHVIIEVTVWKKECKTLWKNLASVTLHTLWHDHQLIQSSHFPQKWFQSFALRLCPICRLVTLSITASLSPNCALISSRCKKKSHLHGASLGEELHTAILHCRTKWISKCLHSYYHIFMCFMQTAILPPWIGLCNIELSIGTSVSLLIMKSPAFE